MTIRENVKNISIINIAKQGAMENRSKLYVGETQERYLTGYIDACEAILDFLKYGKTAELALWCNSCQKIMIDDILSNKVKI